MWTYSMYVFGLTTLVVVTNHFAICGHGVHGRLYHIGFGIGIGMHGIVLLKPSFSWTVYGLGGAFAGDL